MSKYPVDHPNCVVEFLPNNLVAIHAVVRQVDIATEYHDPEDPWRLAPPYRPSSKTVKVSFTVDSREDSDPAGNYLYLQDRRETPKLHKQIGLRRP